MDKLFRIGEMAKLFHMSMSTLRHYENIGLLKPEKVDQKNGYRYYSVRQFEALNTVRYLRALDMPLSEIEDFLQNREVDAIEAKLRQQKEEVAARRRAAEAGCAPCRLTGCTVRPANMRPKAAILFSLTGSRTASPTTWAFWKKRIPTR